MATLESLLFYSITAAGRHLRWRDALPCSLACVRPRRAGLRHRAPRTPVLLLRALCKRVEDPEPFEFQFRKVPSEVVPRITLGICAKLVGDCMCDLLRSLYFEFFSSWNLLRVP